MYRDHFTGHEECDRFILWLIHKKNNLLPTVRSDWLQTVGSNGCGTQFLQLMVRSHQIKIATDWLQTGSRLAPDWLLTGF